LDEVGRGRIPRSFRRGPLGFTREKHMLDLAFVILGAVLFLGALIYARACANV
jgi:hypothetical protein